jgi:hypothetical protein
MGVEKDEGIREAVERISQGKGRLEELDERLAFLKRNVPSFQSSNLMLSLERIVLAKHKAVEIAASLGENLSREQLVELTRKVCTHDGNEIELDACLELLERSVPHPAVSDLIFWNDESLSPEQIVDRALGYKPPADSTHGQRTPGG